MSTLETSEEMNQDRRRFLRNAAMTFAAAEPATMGSKSLQARRRKRDNCPPSSQEPTRRSAH